MQAQRLSLGRSKIHMTLQTVRCHPCSFLKRLFQMPACKVRHTMQECGHFPKAHDFSAWCRCSSHRIQLQEQARTEKKENDISWFWYPHRKPTCSWQQRAISLSPCRGYQLLACGDAFESPYFRTLTHGKELEQRLITFLWPKIHSTRWLFFYFEKTWEEGKILSPQLLKLCFYFELLVYIVDYIYKMMVVNRRF